MSNDLIFLNHKLVEIYTVLQNIMTELKPGEIFSFSVMSPDLAPQLFNGEATKFHEQTYRHRSLKCWLDLAETLNCRMLTPQNLPEGLIRICFQLLESGGWHSSDSVDVTEKYGHQSLFFRLDKSEEAAFLYDFSTAVQKLDLPDGCKVLNLGCHRGTEFGMLNDLDRVKFQFNNFTGIDHSRSAIAQAENDYPESKFICGDLNNLHNLVKERFDLIISIGTLQSPGIDSKKLFMQLVQNYLQPGGAIIIGQPNCRYLESEIKFGAVTKNRQDGEMGLVISDLFFYKKYLQQHKFETYLRGKYYLFLAGQQKGNAH